MGKKQSALFICRHNSGQGQIAEACLARLAGDRFAVESADLVSSDRVNPMVVDVMREEAAIFQTTGRDVCLSCLSRENSTATS